MNIKRGVLTVKKAVILCGGMATRFLPISKSISKEMLPLLDKPILQILVEDLKQAGITDVVVILGRGKECIIRHFDHNIELEQRLKETGKFDFLNVANEPNNLVNMYYRMQDEPKGTGHAVKLVKSFVENEPFVVMFGDEVVFCDGKNIVEQLIENFEKYNKSVIAVQKCKWEDVCKYGIIKPKVLKNGAYSVLDMVEKPKVEDAPSNISYIGPAILTPEIFETLELCKEIEGKELYLTQAFYKLAQEQKLMAQEIVGNRFDMGNKFGFVKANIVACLKDKKFNKDMENYILELADKINSINKQKSN